jgi:hypothetical protein
MTTQFTLQNWLDDHFEHPYVYGQFLDIDRLPITATQHIIYITEAFQNTKRVFAPYSNGQLRQGLWLLATEMHDLSDQFDRGITWDIRKACIQSFKSLNRDLFAKRCDPVTSAYQTSAPDNPLNMICYMWWDIFAFWESLDTNSKNRIDAELLDVMAYSLSIDHIAVQEGALHGLSHIPNHREQAQAIIETFLEDSPNLPDNLLSYALAAKDACNL